MLKKYIPLVTYLCFAAPMAAYASDSGHVACAGRVRTAKGERIGLVVLVEDWRAHPPTPSGESGRDWALTAVYDEKMYKGSWRFATAGYTLVDNRRNITLSSGKQVFFDGTFKYVSSEPATVELKGKLFRPLNKNELAGDGTAGPDRFDVVEGTLTCIDFST